MTSGLLLLPLTAAVAYWVYANVRNVFHPFFVILGSFVVLAAINFSAANAVLFYPLRLSGLGAVTIGLTSLGVGVLLATMAYPTPTGSALQQVPADLNPKGMLYAAAVMIGLCLLSNLAYWSDVSRLLGLTNVIRNPLALRAREMLGDINPNAPQYFFRGSILVAVAVTLAAYLNPGSRLAKIFVLVFLVTAVASIRRAPILVAVSTMLGVAVVSSRNPRQLIRPIVMGFVVLLAFFGYLIEVLGTLDIPFGAILFGYTAGNLSSFQAVLDGHYPASSQQPLENSLYMFYSVFKYIDPDLVPMNVVKPNPYLPLVPNTYTFLADFYLDLGLAGLMLFPLGIGILIGVSYSLAIRRPHFVTMTLFGSVYAVSVMSFIHGEWGWFTIPTSVAYATIAWLAVIRPATAVARVQWFHRRPVSVP